MKRKPRKRSKKKSRKRGQQPFRWKLVALLLLILAGAFGYAWFYGFPLGPLPWQKSVPVGRPVANDAELQIALARLGFSPGSIDGRAGTQTNLALEAFQESRRLPVTGALDTATTELLRIEDPTHAYFELTERASRA